MKSSEIFYFGTLEYADRVAAFRITLEEAKNRVAEYNRKLMPDSDAKVRVIGRHLLIISNCYHFFMPEKTAGIPLSGYYVDGNSGAVEYKKVEGSVPYLHQK